MNTRFILVRLGCQHCLKAIKAIKVLNRHLPEFKQIEVKDNFEWEEFNFKGNPVMDRLDPKEFDGYPFIWIDGVLIDPGETEPLIITIAKLLEDELIYPIKIENKVIG